MSPRPIIIDCDPGQDDALAILMALGSPEELEVLAITAVAGNVPLALTEKNARKIVELARRHDIPVHAGCDRPLQRDPVTAEHVHGRTGLDGTELPEPATPLADGHAVDVIISTLRLRPGRVTLCPLGPLTNIATALLRAPEIAGHIDQIVLMGGAIGEGNITPSAEFNIYADPHAAEIVFGAGVKVTMLGLDVTHQVLTTARARGRHRRARHGRRPGGRRAARVLQPVRPDQAQPPRRADARPVRDRLSASTGAVRRPCMPCRGRDQGEHTLGRTVVDWSGRSGRAANATVIHQVDPEGFFALLTERLARL